VRVSFAFEHVLVKKVKLHTTINRQWRTKR